MKKIIPLVFSLIYAGCTYGYVMGGSNLGYSGYPEFSQFEPRPPYNRDQYSFDQYRNDVERYIRELKEYVENCNSDIERIRERKNEAIEKGDRIINEFNNWARGN